MFSLQRGLVLSVTQLPPASRHLQCIIVKQPVVIRRRPANGNITRVPHFIGMVSLNICIFFGHGLVVTVQC
jgi:hypothetical protein